MKNIKLGTESGYLLGHVQGEEEVYLIHDNPVQLSAFLMKFRSQIITVTNTWDEFLIETSPWFIMYCSNQEYLQNHLLPVLVPMQKGEAEIPKYEPYIIRIELIKKLIEDLTLENAEDTQESLECYEYDTDMLRLNPVISALQEGKQGKALVHLNNLLAEMEKGEIAQDNAEDEDRI